MINIYTRSVIIIIKSLIRLEYTTEGILTNMSANLITKVWIFNRKC